MARDQSTEMVNEMMPALLNYRPVPHGQEQSISTELKIKFDGGLAASGEFDVRTLAPALLSLADLLDTATRQLDSDCKQPQIVIKRVEQASYSATLTIDLAAIAGSLLSTVGTMNVAASIVSNVVTVINLMSRGFRPAEGKHADVNMPPILINGDGNTVNVTVDVYRLAADDGTLASVRNIVDPIRGEAAQTLQISTDGGEDIHLVTRDLDLSQQAEGDDINAIEFDWKLLIVGIPLAAPEHKWQLADNSTSWYVIEDLEFLNQVKSGQVNFAVGDRLDARIRRVQTTNAGITKTDNFVTRVYQVLHSDGPFEQGQLGS